MNPETAQKIADALDREIERRRRKRDDADEQDMARRRPAHGSRLDKGSPNLMVTSAVPDKPAVREGSSFTAGGNRSIVQPNGYAA